MCLQFYPVLACSCIVRIVVIAFIHGVCTYYTDVIDEYHYLDPPGCTYSASIVQLFSLLVGSFNDVRDQLVDVGLFPR